jgi:hypothetical protein
LLVGYSKVDVTSHLETAESLFRRWSPNMTILKSFCRKLQLAVKLDDGGNPARENASALMAVLPLDRNLYSPKIG